MIQPTEDDIISAVKSLERIARALETLATQDAPIQRREEPYEQIVGYRVEPNYVCNRCNGIIARQFLKKHGETCPL